MANRARTITIAANGIELAYEAFGDHCLPLVLLVMGNSAPGLVWPDALCERLASAGFCVVRFDQRDTGMSSGSGANSRLGRDSSYNYGYLID